jgi:hypothetical protein
MADADPTLTRIAASTLGGPGAPDPQKCSSSAMAVLGAAAGEGMRMASLSLDVTSHPLSVDAVEVAVRVDKRARSIVFASAEARSGGKLVYSAQGLFSRAG